MSVFNLKNSVCYRLIFVVANLLFGLLLHWLHFSSGNSLIIFCCIQHLYDKCLMQPRLFSCVMD